MKFHQNHEFSITAYTLIPHYSEPAYSERLALHPIIETNAKTFGYSDPAYCECF